MQITFEGVNGNDEVYMDCLRAICGYTEGKSMIDLCCNLAPHTPKLNFNERTYIDINKRELDHESEQEFFVQCNVLDWVEESRLYDTAICSDGLEHFTEDDGLTLLKLMQLKSKRQVLFTPLGEYMVDLVSTDPEGHHSGWTPEKLESIVPNHFAYVVLPQYHPTLSVGAFFFWHCKGIITDFERVLNELKQKTWAKNLQVSAL